jgi:ATP-binding cassette, subfamily F, member 3
VIRIGKRYGLVGPNGAGKTTLLRLIAGEFPPDEGTIGYSGMTVGYLKQETEEIEAQKTVLEETMQAFSEILELEAEEHRLIEHMDAESDHESEEYHKVMEAFNHVHELLLASDVHLIKPRTESVLSGLGFKEADFNRPLSTFSGGWRMRVALAQLLLRQPDVLLLDEPTNHLDIDSIDWLEEYLKAYPGTVVLVSHDRYFLDRMVNTTVEVQQGQLTEYAGNYEFYLQDRTIRREHQRSAYVNQQKFIAENDRFIDRFRSKASKATQVQSRVKMMAKLDRVAPPPADEAKISFRFPEPPRSGRSVIEIPQFSKKYNSEQGVIPVFDKAGPLMIERGDKIALIGKNGAGKSTLARMLLGSEPFDGERIEGYNVAMTFFAQHQAESLNRKHTPLDALRTVSSSSSETELRTMLGAFLFSGDDVFKTIGVLSGGERSRVALARTLASPANLLVLDEPTNHLDIHSIGVLTEALRQYSGTFVVVSHDRHFLDRVVNKVWRVEDGTVRQFDGNYSDYTWQVEHGTARAFIEAGASAGSPPAKSAGAGATKATSNAMSDSKTPVQNSPSGSGPKSKEQKRQEAQEREIARKKQTQKSPSKMGGLNNFKLKNEYERVESEVEKLESSTKKMAEDLADPKTFANPSKSAKLLVDYETSQKKLVELNKEWEALASEMSARDLA